MRRTLLLLPLTVALSACSNPMSSGPVQGVVTAKVAPNGSIDCAPLVTCETDVTWKIIIEPLPGHKDIGGGWYSPYARICVAPTTFRRLSIGDTWNSDTDQGDIHCDG